MADDLKLVKKKKKKVKASDATPVATTVANGAEKKRKRDAEVADGTALEKKKKKKKKKAQTESTDTIAVPATCASVGDHKLAASRPAIVKELYVESKAVKSIPQADIDAFLEKRSITVKHCSIRPVMEFSQLGLPPDMLQATKEFVAPSPIQSMSWPIILSGRDMIGVAATGSGKTLAFGLPALRHITAQKEAGVVSGKRPVALVMAPTRELAIQISEVLAGAGAACGVRCVCVYGGVPKGPQVAALKRGVEVVVGTPGRLEDLMQDGSCSLEEVTYLVLDEADRMLDLGFEPHIRAIAGAVRADRQTLMFTATWPPAVRQLAAGFLARPARVNIGADTLAASHSVSQVVEVIDPTARDARLLSLLSQHHSSRRNRVLIFVLYKKEAPRVESLLTRKGWKACSIHGDISQVQRQRAVEDFKSGEVPLLIATDVAARGLDIPDVEVVINYSFPLTTEDYVHRIGRTGRAGKKGLAVTFFSGATDKARAGELINVLREAGQPVPEALSKFGTTVKKKESKLYGAHFKDVDVNVKSKKITFDSDGDDD